MRRVSRVRVPSRPYRFSFGGFVLVFLLFFIFYIFFLFFLFPFSFTFICRCTLYAASRGLSAPLGSSRLLSGPSFHAKCAIWRGARAFSAVSAISARLLDSLLFQPLGEFVLFGISLPPFGCLFTALRTRVRQPRAEVSLWSSTSAWAHCIRLFACSRGTFGAYRTTAMVRGPPLPCGPQAHLEVHPAAR